MSNGGIILLMASLFMSGHFATTFAAKPDPERETAFQTITKSYEVKNWAETLLLIERYQTKYPHSDREASLLMLSAECNVKLRRLEKAEALASQVILQFPEVNYAGRARLTIGESALLAGDWEKAELNLAWVVSFSDDVSSVNMAKARLEELRAFQKLHGVGILESSTTEPSKVALILPMSGVFANNAEQFMTGFRYAWKSTGLPDPQVFDSEADPVRAVRLFGKVAKEFNPWVVVGGLSIPEATGLAAFSQSAQIPFLTTSCGDDGLAAISPFTIQGRADYGGLAGQLGRFAALNMGLKKLAIFYVNSVSGRQMVKEFREQAELNGASIQAEITFYPGTIDFTKNMLQLKSAFIRHSFDDSLNNEFTYRGHLFLNDAFYVPGGKDFDIKPIPEINGDGLMDKKRLSSKFLDSLWTKEHRSQRWAVESSHDFDSAAIELPELEGIFVVIEPGTIEMIAPQLTRYRLNRQIFGNEVWDDRETLRKVQRYVNGIVMVNPLAPKNDSAMTGFTSAVFAQGDKAVTSSHLAGERAGKIVHRAIVSAKERSKFRDAITTLNGVETISGLVTFVKEERVDRSQSLIMYKDGNFLRVGE